MEYPEDPYEGVSTDFEYFVPEGVQILSKDSCRISFSSKSINSESEY